MRVSRVDSHRLHARRYYTARAGVNALPYSKTRRFRLSVRALTPRAAIPILSPLRLTAGKLPGKTIVIVDTQRDGEFQ